MIRSLPLMMITVLLAAIPATASTIQNSSLIATPQKQPTKHLLISQTPQGMPIVQEQDWTKKDIKLPWNQLALDKSSGPGETVVFTKSYKFKVGFLSNRKERIHVRWTQNKVEISVILGSGCSAVFGCDSADKYGLPKQITATIGGRDYILQTVDQNTYGLTPEFKQAIAQATTGLINFTIDKKINFEVKEEALPALKQLFAMQPNTSPSQTSAPASNISLPTK